MAHSAPAKAAATLPPPSVSIWWFAFGYFAAYAPYSALTKALSKGVLDKNVAPLDGLVILPIVVLASTLGMFTFLFASGWWRAAGRIQLGRLRIPAPRPLTLISGMTTAVILVTTTLAYTLEGVSIVFAMLLMRGGVLIIAPVVDALARRKVHWTSWTALLLSLSSLFVAFAERGGLALSLAASVDIALYLAAYFVRLRLMTQVAKSEDARDSRRYFVEEQLVASPLSLLVLLLWALLSLGGVGAQEGGLLASGALLREGIVALWAHPHVWVVFLVGLLSQATGIFGGLILLDKRENTFCVPVNRASSVLAGIVATFALWALAGGSAPSAHELVGAVLIIAAIAVLSLPTMIAGLRRG